MATMSTTGAPSLPSDADAESNAGVATMDPFLREYCTRRFGPGMDRDWLLEDHDGSPSTTMAGLPDAGTVGATTHRRDGPASSSSSLSIEAFVSDLGLPRVHPWCRQRSSPALLGSQHGKVQPSYSRRHGSGAGTAAFEIQRHDDYDYGHATVAEAAVTWLYQSVPPRVAFVQLWIRYVSGSAAVVGLLCLVLLQTRAFRGRGTGGGRRSNRSTAPTTTSSKSAVNPKQLDDDIPQDDSPRVAMEAAAAAAVAGSCVALADPMYRYEYGIRALQGFVVAACAVAARACRCTTVGNGCCARMTSLKSHRRLLAGAGLAALLAAAVQDPANSKQGFYYDESEPVLIEPGLYYNENNRLIRRAVSRHWPSHTRTYTSANATWWLHTGDARTGIPYYVNYVPDLDWKSVFLTVRDDESDGGVSNATNNTATTPTDEVVLELALSFPTEGHDKSKPVYLVLHGMNGGTTDGYIRDLTWRRNQAGSTVAVMVARGFMGSPLKGSELFHGARWSDVHAAALALQRALGPGQLLVGVGYSMGAIVVANYAVRSGPDCALDAAVAVSGALECRVEQNYTRAQKLWQPMIAALLRLNYFDRFLPQLASRLTPSQILAYRRATHVVGLDQYTSALYNGYPDLQRFYSDMGALGDIPLEELDRPDLASLTNPPRILQLSTPLLVLHALDDPISTWRTVAASRGVMHPRSLVEGASNLVVLLTERGGHVGWPLGFLSFRRKWEFMNDVAAGFAEAIVQAKIDPEDEPATREDGDDNSEASACPAPKQDSLVGCEAEIPQPLTVDRKMSTLIGTET